MDGFLQGVPHGKVYVRRQFLVFTKDAAKPVVASGIVIGFDTWCRHHPSGRFVRVYAIIWREVRIAEGLVQLLPGLAR